jgi:hypothetical protein
VLSIDGASSARATINGARANQRVQRIELCSGQNRWAAGIEGQQNDPRAQIVVLV